MGRQPSDITVVVFIPICFGTDKDLLETGMSLEEVGEFVRCKAN